MFQLNCDIGQKPEVFRAGVDGVKAGTDKFGFAGEFSGAPTSISQRWPGSPCGGLRPTVGPGVAALFGVPVAGAVVAGAAGDVAVVFSVLPESEQLINPKNKAATAICDVIFILKAFVVRNKLVRILSAYS